MTTKITTPKLKSDTSYTEWKNRFQMWRTLCGYDKKEEAIIVLLHSLNENKKAKKAVSKLTVTGWNADDGLEKLLENLGSTFKTDKIQESFVYKDFNKFQLLEGMSINGYLLEYEHFSSRMIQFDLKLPDNILCLKLLESASISVNEKQIALTTADDLKYDSMKLALKPILLNIPNKSDSSFEMNIKQEELLFKKKDKIKPKFNPTNKQGQISRCAICDSKMHWAKQCPHQSKNNLTNLVDVSDSKDDFENIQIILMTLKTNNNEIFVNEMLCSGVIDTVCSKTVAGKEWFDNYTKMLDDTLLNKTDLFQLHILFKFGDSREILSEKRVIIPAKI